MNCSQANPLLIAYLNEEVSSSQRESVLAHLVDCSNCQEELQILSGLETRLRQHLHLQATQVNPSPKALNTLQARILQKEPRKALDEMKTFSNRFPVQKKGTTPNLALALIVILALLLAAPPALTLAARISDWVGSLFHFSTPGTEGSMSVGGFEAFTPYSPQYLPEGFDSTGIGGTTSPDLEMLTLTYEKDRQFISLLQSKGPGADDLPQGRSIDVNGETGVFVQVFATSSERLQQKIPSIPIVKNFDYGTASLLAWRIGEIRLELVSNLPKEEILKIARSLVPADSSEGELPPSQEP